MNGEAPLDATGERDRRKKRTVAGTIRRRRWLQGNENHGVKDFLRRIENGTLDGFGREHMAYVPPFTPAVL